MARFRSIKSMQKLIDAFFEAYAGMFLEYPDSRGKMKQVPVPPLFPELARESLGLIGDELAAYRNGDMDDDRNPYARVLQIAEDRCRDILIKGGMCRIYDPKTVSIALMNNHGMATTATQANAQSDAPTVERLSIAQLEVRRQQLEDALNAFAADEATEDDEAHDG